MDTKFLTSNRFIALVIIAILGVLKGEGVLDDSVANPLIALALGFVGVRTVDRFGEKMNGK